MEQRVFLHYVVTLPKGCVSAKHWRVYLEQNASLTSAMNVVVFKLYKIQPISLVTKIRVSFIIVLYKGRHHYIRYTGVSRFNDVEVIQQSHVFTHA